MTIPLRSTRRLVEKVVRHSWWPYKTMKSFQINPKGPVLYVRIQLTFESQISCPICDAVIATTVQPILFSNSNNEIYSAANKELNPPPYDEMKWGEDDEPPDYEFSIG